MGRKFKSFTDINNYNKFLLDLDKKQSINNDNNNDIPEVLKNIDKTYHSFEYNSNNFTGANNWERIIAKLRNLDPNLYEDLNTKCTDTKCTDTKCADTKCADTKCDTKNKLVNKKEKEKEKSSVKEIEPIIKHHVSINVEINNIGDLLELINQHPDVKETKYNINMKALHKIKEPLTELNNMIGMKSLKENIVDQIIFYIQNLHKTQDKTKKSSNDFMHTVIYGPPGTGKTEVAKIMGQIFSKIGILEKGTFKKVTRSDLVAGYLGQTAIKTTDVIKECLGGVLFIDEAYALGNPEKRDIFSKECIDTICEALSNYKDNLMVIIAGYETDLNECFFNYNQGLNSRFTWRFKTDDYSAEDLYKIFIKKVYDENWSISENENEKVTIKWFEKNKSTFRFYGRDIETLFAKIKIAHSRRVFCLDDNIKKILIIKDINKGLEMFIKNENSENKRAENLKKVVSSMYL
jgi:Holliday junction resolvasome RuvABC ATP-dependent DNA helicase subunit